MSPSPSEVLRQSLENHLGADDTDDEKWDVSGCLTERYQVGSGAEKGPGSRPCVCVSGGGVREWGGEL